MSFGPETGQLTFSLLGFGIWDLAWYDTRHGNARRPTQVRHGNARMPPPTPLSLVVGVAHLRRRRHDATGRSSGTSCWRSAASLEVASARRSCLRSGAAGLSTCRPLAARRQTQARAPAHVAAAGVAIRTLTVESAHGGGKFSRHLLLQALGPDEHVAEPRCVLAGLGCAHAVAARVVARVVARCGQSAGSLVDFALPLLSVFRLCVCCLVCVCSCGYHGWCGRDGTWNDSPLYFPIFFT